MRDLARALGMAALLLSLAIPSFASFQSSDLIIIPAVANTEGEEDSFWISDIYIVNLDEVAVDVCLYMMPNGASDNNAFLVRADYGLGGRADEGFRFVDERLADIPPYGSVVLENPVGEYWGPEIGSRAALGAVLVFAYEAGSLDDRDTYPDGPVPRNIFAQSRVYNTMTLVLPDPDDDTQTIEQEATFGQAIPGVPWYNLADGGVQELSAMVLVGGMATDDLRVNVGVFNASDRQTTITINVEPFFSNGESVTDGDGNQLVRQVQIPPLGHMQFNGILSDTFGIEDEVGLTMRVSLVGWTTTSNDPRPMFTAYGSMVDAHSNDGMTLLPSFIVPYDVECVWGEQPDVGDAKSTYDRSREGRRRPLDVPAW